MLGKNFLMSHLSIQQVLVLFRLTWLAISPQRNNALDLPILTILKESYLLWHNFLPHLPRLSRYTLGVKIDKLFIEALELSLTAQYTRREDKLTFLKQFNRKLDNLKFFITILWEAKWLDANKYAQLSQKLATAGRILGKWIQSIPPEEKTI